MLPTAIQKKQARTRSGATRHHLILDDGDAFSVLFLCRRHVEDTVFAFLFRLGFRQEEQKQLSFFLFGLRPRRKKNAVSVLLG